MVLSGSPWPVMAIGSPARTKAGVPKQVKFPASVACMVATKGDCTNKVANIVAQIKLASVRLIAFQSPLRRRARILRR